MAEVGDALSSVMIQFGFCGDTVSRRIFAVVALVVKGRRVALVVRRNDAAAQECGLAVRMTVSRTMIHFGHGIGLGQILRVIADVLNDSHVGLEDRVFVFEL